MKADNKLWDGGSAELFYEGRDSSGLLHLPALEYAVLRVVLGQIQIGAHSTTKGNEQINGMKTARVAADVNGGAWSSNTVLHSDARLALTGQ